jgi:hypothetical protein
LAQAGPQLLLGLVIDVVRDLGAAILEILDDGGREGIEPADFDAEILGGVPAGLED